MCNYIQYRKPKFTEAFPGSSAGKESACSVGDLGLIPGLGRSPGKGNRYTSQCSCLKYSWIEEPGRLSMGSQRVGQE